MISFFRKIRKKMADDNRPLKYFRYAIGEIVLVVIGILIALQINNWNEDRKERMQEIKILNNLHDEFQENLQNLKFKDSVLHSSINSLETIFRELRSPQKTIKGTSIDSILSRALNTATWTPSEFVLNDLKSSGNMTKLHNDTLKKLLYTWSRFYSDLGETQNMIETTNKELIRYLKDHGSLRNVDVQFPPFDYGKSMLIENNEHLLSDPVFENYVDDKLYILHTARRQFDNAENLILSILRETERLKGK